MKYLLGLALALAACGNAEEASKGTAGVGGSEETVEGTGGVGGAFAPTAITKTFYTIPMDAIVYPFSDVDYPPLFVAAGTGGDDTVAYWTIPLLDMLPDAPEGSPTRIEMCNALIVEDREVVGVFGPCTEREDALYEDGILVLPLTSTELVFTSGPGPEHTLYYQQVRVTWELL